MELVKEITKVYTKLKEKKNLKYMFFFLMINLIFMFVEVLYGLISNSLGLLTDGAHMLLDCSAIIIGLYSSYLSDKSPDSAFNFGYARSEVLGTFINSVFLVFIALYIVFESLERFISPKEIHSDHLILISFLGLVVNLIGVYFFHGEHSHAHGGSCGSHSHSASHSHSDESDVECGNSNHSHDHHHQSHDHSHDHHHHNKTADKSEYNENLYAIYIHILADALGSVSVLISSFLIRYYGLNFTDPLCSLFISVMILYSAWPVLKSSSATLLHLWTDKMTERQKKIENSINSINSASVCSFDMWALSKTSFVCDLKIRVETEDKEEVYQMVKSILRENSIDEFYIEINNI